ncbi:S-protein homolog 74-like [Jatropha curcas]|uniref:S-protein homolog 74-like n=1 Tax=Jatropha curcas TaxID=180498 RepID=UPI0005FB1EB0|nr:S-protein homolog 74-like [Jatropha curcas]
MSFPIIKTALFLLILASILATNPSSASQDLPKPLSSAFKTEFHLHIVNGLSKNKILLVHCKSKDDDLGIHNITVGSEFSWKFTINFFWTTLYWCYLAPDDHSHVSLKVFYNNGRLLRRCKTVKNRLWGYVADCIWIAKDNGVYMKNIDANTDDFVSAWERGRLIN